MTITAKSTIKVKEWFGEKINEEAKGFHLYLIGEYKNGMMDHSQLRVEEVLRETEKAFQVALDAETANGDVRVWKCWIPKSVIVKEEA